MMKAFFAVATVTVATLCGCVSQSATELAETGPLPVYQGESGSGSAVQLHDDRPHYWETTRSAAYSPPPPMSGNARGAITPGLRVQGQRRPAGAAVLFIGDSHSNGTFGHTLASLIKENTNAQLTAVASCGSGPRWWLNGQPTRCGFWRLNADGSETKSRSESTPRLDDLLSSVHPTTVIVALGSNLIPENPAAQRADTQAFLSRIAGKGYQCIWVGPPASRKFSPEQTKQVSQMLREVVESHGCTFVDSGALTHYPATGGDGLHYGGPEGTQVAAKWANAVFHQALLATR